LATPPSIPIGNLHIT